MAQRLASCAQLVVWARELSDRSGAAPGKMTFTMVEQHVL